MRLGVTQHCYCARKFASFAHCVLPRVLPRSQSRAAKHILVEPSHAEADIHTVERLPSGAEIRVLDTSSLPPRRTREDLPRVQLAHRWQLYKLTSLSVRLHFRVEEVPVQERVAELVEQNISQKSLLKIGTPLLVAHNRDQRLSR